MDIVQEYSDLKEHLNNHPKQLENARNWLFILANTARAMIENRDKTQLGELEIMFNKATSQELKLAFDFCQGRFGQEGFSYRRHPNYFYLSSLVATFPEFVLSEQDQAYLKEVLIYNKYFLYDIH
ncbi:hypothetical protein ABID29_001177 [Streptococcus rupicaprae]|uniref:Uncharacterized protein n=1 Tax=Streptococcus rupicaprae TaxID=759619 RepID=A0ABV2FHN2_9STRE